MRHDVINKFNRGEIDSKALSRDDVEKVRNSCSLLENWFPIRLGPMQYRQGMGYIGAVAGESYQLPFIAAADDTAIIELSDNLARVWVDDALITRTTVTSTIANGTFDSDVTSWSDADEAGAASVWGNGGYMDLLGTGNTSAIRHQTITAETGVEHGVRIIIADAPVTVKIGISGVGSTEIVDDVLSPGTHSLVFTPSANFTVTLSNSSTYTAKVDSVVIESSGTMTIPTNVATADLPDIRFTQSADVIFCAVGNDPVFRIERRGIKSWSVVDLYYTDGPFESINQTDITLSPSALAGDVTLTASKDLFNSNHIGGLFKIASDGQNVTASVSAQDNGTGSIKVFGTSTGRNFTVQITGTWAGRVTLQRSVDDLTWEDTSSSWTGNVTISQNDGIDNAIYFYRLHIKTGDYTSGTAELDLIYAAGSIEGIAKITNITSSTVVSAIVLRDFGSITATRNWYQGSWGGGKGYPSAVTIYEGRLWLAGSDKLWGSVSDAYTLFDRDLLGNSASILRTIGFGPVETINWLSPSTRLLMGVATSEISVRSTEFGEPLTADNANLKAASTRGTAAREPLQIDDEVYFVQRSGTKIYEATYSSEREAHVVDDIMKLNQQICSAGIKRIAVSREPETRIWVILNDGEARCYLVDFAEEVKAWTRVTTDGLIEDVCVLPSTGEDDVYFIVNRTGGRYLEKMAHFNEAQGASISKHSDSFLSLTSPGTVIPVAHLNAKIVNVWADGQDRGDFTVASNQITVPTAWTNVIVGLPYAADYVSSKISGYIPVRVINTRKRIVDTGFVLENYVPGKLMVGPSMDLLEQMPDYEDGSQVDTTTTIADYDYLPFTFNGEEESDPRMYVRATGPCTVLSLSYGVLQSGDTGEN